MHVLLAVLFALLVALSRDAHASEASTPASQLDVVVEDGQGRPISGLSREDFEVRLDGQAVQVESVERSEDVLRLLLLFDQTDLTAKEQGRIGQGLAKRFHGGMPSGVEAAVAVYDSRIRVVQPFTAVGGIVAEVIENLATPDVGEAAESFGRQQLIRDINRIQTCDPIEEVHNCTPEVQREIWLRARDVLFQLEQQIHSWNDNLEDQLDALAQGVRSVAGLPGRKVVLYIGSGLDPQPGRELLRLWDDKFGPIAPGEAQGVQQATLTSTFDGPLQQVLETANAARVTLYAVATVGDLDQRAVSGRERRLNLRPSRSPAARADRTWDAADDAAFRVHQGTGINRLSHMTGGEAVFGSTNLGHVLDRIELDAESTYTLHLHADEGPDASRGVEVRLPNHDARLRHRMELAIRDPRQEAIDRTLAALGWGTASNPLGVEIAFQPTQPAPEGEGVVQPIQLKFPMGRVVWQEGPTSFKGRLTAFAGSQDADGTISPIETIEVPLEVPLEAMAEARAGFGGYRFGLVLRPGQYRFAVGVLDEGSGIVSVVTSEHHVAAADAS